MAKATASWLHYGLALSFGRVEQLMARFGINMTAGAICRSSAHSACTDLVAVHAELVARANRSATITMDESGWRVGGSGEWLWVAANDEITLCWIAEGRGFDQATEVIAADYDGVLVRDGYVVYDHYTKATHQSCTAHIVRRCHEMEADLPRPDAKIPAAVKAILLDGLAARDLPGPDRPAAAVELRARLDSVCARPVGHDANRRLLKHVGKQANALFTFLTNRGASMPPTSGANRPCGPAW